jgi:hypothetical protein
MNAKTFPPAFFIYEKPGERIGRDWEFQEAAYFGNEQRGIELHGTVLAEDGNAAFEDLCA